MELPKLMLCAPRNLRSRSDGPASGASSSTGHTGTQVDSYSQTWDAHERAAFGGYAEYQSQSELSDALNEAFIDPERFQAAAWTLTP